LLVEVEAPAIKAMAEGVLEVIGLLQALLLLLEIL
jgi:hypothetical protein